MTSNRLKQWGLGILISLTGLSAAAAVENEISWPLSFPASTENLIQPSKVMDLEKAGLGWVDRGFVLADGQIITIGAAAVITFSVISVIAPDQELIGEVWRSDEHVDIRQAHLSPDRAFLWFVTSEKYGSKVTNKVYVLDTHSLKVFPVESLYLDESKALNAAFKSDEFYWLSGFDAEGRFAIQWENRLYDKSYEIVRFESPKALIDQKTKSTIHFEVVQTALFEKENRPEPRVEGVSAFMLLSIRA